jgi:Trypsin-like peptidase domain/Colicin V production protein
MVGPTIGTSSDRRPSIRADRGTNHLGSRGVTKADWLIVGFAALMGLIGYRRGFIVGVLSLIGFVAGAFLGTRIAPLLLNGGSASPYAPVFGLLGALFGGLVLATAFEGVGRTLRRALPLPGLGILDGTLGLILSVTLALALAWIFGAVALQTPGAGGLRHDIQRSAILRRLNAILPPSGVILHALARFDPLGSINGPQADVGPPNAAIAHEPHVAAAADGVVRVLGTACGLGVEGSGWIAAPGIVVTNAHVVAGESDTTVQLHGSGEQHPAHVIAFDSHNDIAVLRVGGLGGSVLTQAGSAPSGTSGALLGFPKDGPYDVRAVRLAAAQTVLTDDAYGHGPVSRKIVPLRGLVRPGNSGGPVVDADGRVVATVFAATEGERRHGGYAIPDDIVAHLLDGASGTVSTGPCAQ